ncbi:thiamine pyrophosphate-binding protein [Sphingomonas sp. BIUV-7]|uniref:Thiamine pyrophosphate-binding protein n=1 Tax=Sphingomonas natans TaxID=3063330 RepID=A0ABT8Y3Z1_9SPHN|nr:thiamine pyrophosphate-binding protein [Sphingomonas sp. BIUV-7]MDO6413029.1 thiamine pyrophosphate-binding protein [Sphingomonas sp. BIUV-7]
MSETVAHLLVDTLARIGVRHIFGIVGDALNPFTEAIRADGRLEWIGVRHEEGAALAAAGQAKLTGRLGVCCGTTGPGGNHLVAGLYEARKDHAPVLAISGGVPSGLRGTDYLQEDDPVSLFRDVSVYSELLASAEQAPALIHQAIAMAYGERGVAHISIPPDIFAANASGPLTSLATLRPRPDVLPDPADIALAASMIGEAKTVAIFCGEGCRGAGDELRALAGLLKAPLLHSYRGKDIMPHDEPLWMGGVGLIGGKPGVDALNDADLLLMLGTDYPYGEFLPSHGRVIQIDERAGVMGRRAPISLGVVGSVRPALLGLLERLPGRLDTAFSDGIFQARQSWDDKLDARADPARSDDRIHPPRLARLLSDLSEENAVIVTDTGEVTLWAGNWTRQKRGQRICGSFNNAAVGTGLGIANGIQALDRKRQVILHVGDGGMSMLMSEFITAVEHDLPIKVVVYDNQGWGLVHLEMEGAGNPAPKGASLMSVDFAAFALACGADGFRVREPARLEESIRTFLALPGPAILHVDVDPNEIPLMPRLDIGQAARFGLAKAKEILLGISGA